MNILFAIFVKLNVWIMKLLLLGMFGWLELILILLFIGALLVALVVIGVIIRAILKSKR